MNLGHRKKIIIGLFGLFLVVVGMTISANYVIEKSAEDFTYSIASEVPKNKVGLLLGTSKYLRAGGINPYFKYRIDAAIQLYQFGKIDFILVSGDNRHRSYNEPVEFQKELMKHGIPEDRIVLDYAGFRTLDSVIRAQEVFGQKSFTIISQEFHNERAIYLAHKHGIQAIGFNAKDLKGRQAIKVMSREYLARTKAVLDVLRGVEPKFLGTPISID